MVPFEINVRKRKWLVLAIYEPPQQNSRYFVQQMSELLDQYFKSSKGRYIGLMFANHKHSFMQAKSFESGL